MEKDRARRNELQLFKGMEEEMQKKLSEYQRTIKTLTKKLSDGDAKLTDTSIQDDLTKKYEQKCTEYDSLFVQYNRLQEDAINDKERYGKIWNVLMNYYYDFQKRGVRRPLNKLEIEANPERFVVELLFGVFEANPMRFRKAIRKQMGAENTNASLGGTSFFADETHNEDDLHQDSLSIMPDEHKWWSTQNTAYLTTPNSPDFAIVNNPGSTGSGFSVPSSNKTNRGAQSSKSVQGLKPNRNPTCRSTGVQTDESYFAANLQNRNRPAADDSLSLTSSNFVIDSFSAPNLRTASGVLSTSGSSVFMDGFGGASVDRGLGGHKLRKTTVNFSNFDPISFSRKKKISKKIVLPRMNHLATPPTPQTDFSISGHQAGFVPNNSQSQNLL